MERKLGAEETRAGCVHFSCASVEWETPQWLFDELSWTFGGFTLDPCATDANAKCARFFTREVNGLAQRWEGKVFMNPPYGRHIDDWVRKALRSRAKERSSSACFRRVPIRAGGRISHGAAMSGSCAGG